MVTDLTKLTERVGTVEEQQSKVALAVDLATLTQRIIAIEARKDELGQLRLSPMPRTDVEPEEMTFGSEKGWGN